MNFRRKIAMVAVVAAVAAVAGYSIYTSQKSNVEMSDITMANVEALARGENDSLCPNGCISSGDGCACNGVYYPKWQEYPWGN